MNKIIEKSKPNQNCPFGEYSFMDSYAINVSRQINAYEVAKTAFDNAPKWFESLMNLRDKIVNIIGLKMVSNSNGETIGGFPIIAKSDAYVFLGFDDSHLNFCINIETIKIESGTKIIIATWVKTHNIIGKTYLFLIMPFHKLISKAMLINLYKILN